MKTTLLSFPPDRSQTLSSGVLKQTAVKIITKKKVYPLLKRTDRVDQIQSQQKALLLILNGIYWITALAVCWFSYDTVITYLTQLSSELNPLLNQRP